MARIVDFTKKLAVWIWFGAEDEISTIVSGHCCYDIVLLAETDDQEPLQLHT